MYAVIECNHIVLNCILTFLSVLKVLTLSWFLSSELPDSFLSSGFPDCFLSSEFPDCFLSSEFPDCFLSSVLPEYLVFLVLKYLLFLVLNYLVFLVLNLLEFLVLNHLGFRFLSSELFCILKVLDIIVQGIVLYFYIFYLVCPRKLQVPCLLGEM